MGKDLAVAVLPPRGAGGAAAAATNSPASIATGADRLDTAMQVLCTGRDLQENEGGSQQGLGAENEGHEAVQTLLEIVAIAAAAAAEAAVAAAAVAAAAAAVAAAAAAAVQPRGPTPTIAGTANLSARAPNQRGRLAIPENSIQQ